MTNCLNGKKNIVQLSKKKKPDRSMTLKENKFVTKTLIIK